VNKIKTIQGNYLAPSVFLNLYDWIFKCLKRNAIVEDNIFIKISNSELLNRVTVSLLINGNNIVIKNGSDLVWAPTTIWYRLAGWYMLGILKEEIFLTTVREASNVKERIITENLNSLFHSKNISSYDISMRINELSKIKGTPINLFVKENISLDFERKSVFFKIYFENCWNEWKEDNSIISDYRLINVMNTLWDGISELIKNKKEYHDVINNIIDALNINDTESLVYQLKYLLRKKFKENILIDRKYDNTQVTDLMSRDTNRSKVYTDRYVEGAHIMPVSVVVDKLLKKYSSKEFKKKILMITFFMTKTL